MTESQSLLFQKEWRIIDQSSLGPTFDAKQSFAIDDTLCERVGSGVSAPTIRSWVHHNTIVLGIQDTRLPHLDDGIAFLNNQGYNVIVRNSGGLAVVLDSGVLNLSLIVPDTERGIDINRGYDAMFELVQHILSPYQAKIEAKEIVGSYCPGSYDLSINNQKFAGISQRRLRNGVAVQIYLNAFEQPEIRRADLIKGFYEKSLKGETTKFTYPTIKPETMASLSELIGEDITISTLMLQLLQTLQQFSEKLSPSQLFGDEIELYQFNLQRMLDRNERALKK